MDEPQSRRQLEAQALDEPQSRKAQPSKPHVINYLGRVRGAKRACNHVGASKTEPKTCWLIH